nr:hypothetical protein [Tanacetum cinerariifolium]
MTVALATTFIGFKKDNSCLREGGLQSEGGLLRRVTSAGERNGHQSNSTAVHRRHKIEPDEDTRLELDEDTRLEVDEDKRLDFSLTKFDELSKRSERNTIMSVKTISSTLSQKDGVDDFSPHHLPLTMMTLMPNSQTRARVGKAKETYGKNFIGITKESTGSQMVSEGSTSAERLATNEELMERVMREDHTSDWLRVVPISGLGQPMNGIFTVIMLYHVLGLLGLSTITMLFVTPLSTSVFDQGFQLTRMANFVPGRAVIDAAQHKRGKYMTKCADIGYGFLPFSFSSFGELEKDAMTLLKREWGPDSISASHQFVVKLCFSDRGVVSKVLGQLQFPYLGSHFRSYLVCDVIDPPLLQQRQQQHPTKKCFCVLLFICASMAIVRFHCPFPGLSGCHDGGGNRLTKTFLITHLCDRHCNDDAQATTKHVILTHLVVFERAELDLVDGLLHDQHDGFTLSLLDNLFSKGCVRKKVSPMPSNLGCRRKICDGHYTAAVRVLSSSGVALYNDATLQELKAKHPFKSAPSLPDTPIHHHHLIASETVVLDRIKSFPRSTSCGRDGLRAKHLVDWLRKCPMILGEYIASALLTPLVKPGGGIHLIDVSTVWRRLVSKVSATMVGHSLDGYLDGLQFGVGVPGGGEAILYVVNRLVEDRRDDLSLSMLLVDFQNDFNLIDRMVMLDEGDPLGPLLFSLVLHPLICKIRDSFNLCLQAWYLDDGTIVGDSLVVGKVVELIKEDGPRCGLHLNVDKTELLWPKEDPRSRLEGVFSPNISRTLHGLRRRWRMGAASQDKAAKNVTEKKEEMPVDGKDDENGNLKRL